MLPAHNRQPFTPTIGPIRWMILHQILRMIRATLAARLKVISNKAESTTNIRASTSSLVAYCVQDVAKNHEWYEQATCT